MPETVPRRRLGDSDLEVSEISLGSWLTYSGGVERDQTEACTRAAFDAGINFFDTANAYGRGAAESAWGEILADYPRDSYILATKVFFPMSDTDRGLSADQIGKQLDASLTRLATDYVDLYQCHRFDVDTPIEETMEALSEAVRSGKVRYLGFSEWTPQQIEAGLSVDGAVKFVSSQPQYSMLWRAPEAEVIPICERHSISQVCWSPLAEGVLTGKYQPGQEPPSDSRGASEAMSTVHRSLSERRHAHCGPEAATDRRRGRADAWPSWRSPGCCASPTSRRRSSARPGPNRSPTTSPPPASGSAGTPSNAINDTLGDLPVTAPTLAPGASSGVTHRST